MKKLGMVLLAGTLLLTPSCKFLETINPFGKKARQAEAQRQQQEALRVADSIRVANENAAREAEAQRQEELARQAEQAALEKSKYHIIVGSFLTPAYADDWMKQINSMGFTSQIVEKDGGRWRLVSVGAFPSLGEAWTKLEDVQNNVHGDAWVFKRE